MRDCIINFFPEKNLALTVRYVESTQHLTWQPTEGTEQRTQVRNALLDWAKVTSGVLQDSSLGPTLFLSSVHDVPEGLESYLNMAMMLNLGGTYH